MAGMKIANLGITREQGFLYFINKVGDVCKVKMVQSGRGRPEIVERVGVTRKPGRLYYVDKDGDVCEVKMNRKGGKKKKASELLKPSVKYLAYSTKNAQKKRILKSKKILLPGKVKNLKVKTSKSGALVSYSAKSNKRYKSASKEVSLKKPVLSVRIVNKVPKKYK